MAETQVAHGKDIPDAKAIEAIDKLTVYDGDNKAIPFPDLYKDTDKTLFVFVRHFYCGRCQDYINSLVENITLEELQSHNLSIKIIGHGEPHIIKTYYDLTSSPFPIYTDPSLSLQKALALGHGVTTSPITPSWIRESVVASFFKGIRDNFKFGLLKGGSGTQNGGEFVVSRAEEWSWGWRMRFTDDHTDVKEIRKVLGLGEKKVEKAKESE